MKLITPSALVERLKINGPSRGRDQGAPGEGMIDGLLPPHQWIFTRDVAAEYITQKKTKLPVTSAPWRRGDGVEGLPTPSRDEGPPRYHTIRYHTNTAAAPALSRLSIVAPIEPRALELDDNLKPTAAPGQPSRAANGSPGQ